MNGTSYEPGTRTTRTLLTPLFLFAKQDLWRTDESVYLLEPIDGDAILMGETITLKGDISGDVLALGRDITISAYVAKDIRVAAERVVIEGVVLGNVMVLAGEVILASGSDISGNVYLMSEEVDVRGVVRGNLRSWSNEMRLLGTAQGTVDAGEVSGLTFGEDAAVFGDVRYSAESPFAISEERVQGIVQFKPIGEDTDRWWRKINWLWEMVWMFGRIALSLVFIHFFTPQIKKAMIRMVERPLHATLLGAVFLFIIPIAAVLLMVTLVGAPLGLVVLALWLLMLYLAPVLTASMFPFAPAPLDTCSRKVGVMVEIPRFPAVVSVTCDGPSPV